MTDKSDDVRWRNKPMPIAGHRPPARDVVHAERKRWSDKVTGATLSDGSRPAQTTSDAAGVASEFVPGDEVRVRQLGDRRHHRTPAYVQGRVGRIERCCGFFRNPESLAYGGDGLPQRRLYRVRFLQHELWPDYEGAASDTLEVEVYDHWIEPAHEVKCE